MKTVDDKAKHATVSGARGALAQRGFRIRLSCWRGHCALTALLLAVAGTAFAVGLDWLVLRRQRWGPLQLASLTNVVYGVAVFLLLYFLLSRSKRHQDEMLERLRVIDEMNHHIRSALQVISFNARATAGNEWELAEMRRSLERIQWVLREVLPRVEPEYEPFESSNRAGNSPDTSPRAPEKH